MLLAMPSTGIKSNLIWNHHASLTIVSRTPGVTGRICPL